MPVKMVPFVLVVQEPPPDFFPTIDPSTQAVRQGQLATYQITLAGVGGFVGPVELVVSGAPDDAVIMFDKPILNVGETAILTIDTARMGTGSYGMTLQVIAP